MLAFALKRLGIALLVALTVSLITFSMIYVSGDPAIAIAGEGARPADIDAIRKFYGFDRPIAVQYLDWLAGALRGDFGRSYTLRQPVADVIFARLPVTMILGACAIAFALVLAIPLGVLAAVRPNSFADRFALTLAVVGQAMPSFWFALTLILWLGVVWRLLPITGSDSWQNFVMPAIALGYYVTPAVMRLTRAGVIEVLSSDYIRTARAKGLRPMTVLFKHALRNAIIPVVSLTAVQFGFMLGGSIVIETIFQINGLGYLAWESIQRKDLPDHAGHRAGAVGDLCAADTARRPAECLSRSAAEGGVMAETSMPRAGMVGAEEILAPSPGALLRRRIFHHWGLVIGGTILMVIVLMALLAPLVAPYDPYDQQLARKLIPPIWHASAKATWAHPLGTDHLGRDYLTRLLYGAQISLLIGLSAMLISGIIGTTMGVLAGYFGGRLDMVVNFIITTRLSMPVVLVALAVVSLIGSSLTVVIWVLGLLIWDRFAVVMRSATQQVRSREFIAAAQAVGCSTPRILLTEIAPNVLNHLIVVATLEMAHAILLEAALSFLGLGVQPPTPSWGLMISEAKGLMFFDAWLISIPGIALFLLVLAINLLGDGLRDVTAPENRN